MTPSAPHEKVLPGAAVVSAFETLRSSQVLQVVIRRNPEHASTFVHTFVDPEASLPRDRGRRPSDPEVVEGGPILTAD